MAKAEKQIEIQEVQEKPKTQAELCGTDHIDYKELTGDTYKEYEKIVDNLRKTDLYFFDKHKARIIKRDRYEGLVNSPKVTVGIEIINDRPECTTKIEARQAIELNRQLENSHFYYLISKHK